MGAIEETVEGMDPGEAAAEMARALKKLFPVLDEEDRVAVVMGLVGESEGDRLASMVHL